MHKPLCRRIFHGQQVREKVPGQSRNGDAQIQARHTPQRVRTESDEQETGDRHRPFGSTTRRGQSAATAEGLSVFEEVVIEKIRIVIIKEIDRRIEEGVLVFEEVERQFEEEVRVVLEEDFFNFEESLQLEESFFIEEGLLVKEERLFEEVFFFEKVVLEEEVSG